MVICLEVGADVHMAQLMPAQALPFWYRLTWVVPEKGPLNGCVCMCVYCLVPAHPGSPGQRAVKRGGVCVCVCEGRKAELTCI